MKRRKAPMRGMAVAAVATALSACAAPGYNGSLGVPPRVGLLTRTAASLAALPAPQRRINVAVYDFPDLTGQNRPNQNYADYSRAITQGAAAIVVNALKTAGSGTWFNVVERTAVDNLLRERRLIQDTYEVLKKSPSDKIKPLEFAEYLVAGGIISFDAPILAGGVSATVSGVGASINENRNLITINLRLLRVKDGAVLTSIDVSRQILSASGTASASRPTFLRRTLDAEASLTIAEATQIAVREAIEAGVHELIREGVARGLWSLDAGRRAPAVAAMPVVVKAAAEGPFERLALRR